MNTDDSNTENDLPPACIFENALTINYESTWPGLSDHNNTVAMEATEHAKIITMCVF